MDVEVLWGATPKLNKNGVGFEGTAPKTNTSNPPQQPQAAAQTQPQPTRPSIFAMAGGLPPTQPPRTPAAGAPGGDPDGDDSDHDSRRSRRNNDGSGGRGGRGNGNGGGNGNGNGNGNGYNAPDGGYHGVPPPAYLTQNAPRDDRPVKMTGIPKFDGKDVRFWLKRIEIKYNQHGKPISELNKIYYAGETIDEKTKAYAWFKRMVGSTERPDGIKRWEEFKTSALDTFLTVNEELDAANEMRQLKYKGNIHEYITEIHNLNRVAKADGFMLSKIVFEAMPQQIYLKVSEDPTFDLRNSDAFLRLVERTAAKIESFWKAASKQPKFQFGEKGQAAATATAAPNRPKQKSATPASRRGSMRKSTPRRSFTPRTQTPARFSSTRPTPRSTTPAASVVCYYCHKPGHKSDACPDLPRKSIERATPFKREASSVAVRSLKRKADDDGSSSDDDAHEDKRVHFEDEDTAGSAPEPEDTEMEGQEAEGDADQSEVEDYDESAKDL